MYFKYKSASADLKFYNSGDGYFRLVNLYSEETGQGHATQLMQNICKFADEQQKDILLVARPFGKVEGMLSDVRLRQFYIKFGFTTTDEKRGSMIRYPQKIHPL